MAAAATVVVLLRIGWNRRAVVALLTPVAIALTTWFAFFYWIWGTVSPSAPYGASEPTTLRALARGAPGLIFDQEFGIVSTAPILLMAIVGLVQMLRSGGASARRALELSFVFGALLGTVGAFHIWWGGEASTGRPVASGVLLLGVPIATAFGWTATRPSARAGCHVLLATSLAIVVTLVVVRGGALVHNDRDGTAVLIDWASPLWPLASAFPSFLRGSLFAAFARTIAWLTLVGIVGWLVHLLRPRDVGGASLATIVFGFAGAVALTSLANTTTTLPSELAPESRARVPLLDRFDPDRRPMTVLYGPLSLIPPADALARAALVARPGLRTAPQPIDLLWNARFALPAGEYRVRLARPAPAPAATTLSLQIGRAGPALERWDVAGADWEHRLVLPIDAVLVGFRRQPDLDATHGTLQITPVSVVGEGRRIVRPQVIGARRYGAVTAFFHDDQAFPEPAGLWTRGRARAQVTYAASGNSSAAIAVVVRCGPAADRVRLSTPGWSEQLAIEPGGEGRIAIPTTTLPGLDVRVAPLDISVNSGFVPAEVDRTSTDRRFLGCWIAVGS
jgi:uncharacterized membrane protein YeaQ/YmgE (transglycosylase-associated protein family)